MKSSDEAYQAYRRRTSARWASLIPAATLQRAYQIWANQSSPSNNSDLYLKAQASGEILDALSYALLLKKVTDENQFGDPAWTSSITGLAAFRCVEVFMASCRQHNHPHQKAFINYMKHTAQGHLDPIGWIKDDLALKIAELPWLQTNDLAHLPLEPLSSDEEITKLINRYMGN